MTASRNRPASFSFFLIAATLATPAVQAQAPGQPRSLLPPVLMQGEDVPSGMSVAPPPAPVMPLDLSTPALNGTPAAGGISLTPPAESFIVAPGFADGPESLSGDPAQLLPALDRVPVPAASTAARDLTRQMLALDPADPAVLARVAALRLRAGDGDDLARLAQRPDFAALPPEAIAATVKGLAAAADRRLLCNAGLDGLGGGAGGNIDVLRAIALCRAAAGNAGGAQIVLDLAREQAPLSAGFERLIATLQGLDQAGADVVDTADPLGLWAALTLGLALGPAQYDHAPPLALGPLVDANAPLELRIAAAERGVALGVVAPETLAGLYAQGPAPTARLSDEPAALRRAALHRAVVEASGPAVRAQAINALIEAGREEGLSAALARVELQAIIDLSAQSLPPPIGAGLVRAALLAGDAVPALAQATRLGRESADSRDFEALWPYLMVLGAAPDGDPEDWLDTLARGERGDLRKNLVVALFDALALPVGEDLVAFRPALSAQAGAIEADFATGSRSLPLLSVLALLGDRPLDVVAPADLGLAIASLRRLGLGDAAADLAIEALLSAGL